MVESLFYAVLVGLALGVLYVFLRLFRYVFRDKLFFDLLFWIISAVVVFCYFLIFNNGAIRVPLIIAVLVGMVLAVLTLGSAVDNVQKRLARGITNRVKSLKKVLQKIYNIYYNIWVKLRTFIKGGKNGKGRKE